MRLYEAFKGEQFRTVFIHSQSSFVFNFHYDNFIIFNNNEQKYKSCGHTNGVLHYKTTVFSAVQIDNKFTLQANFKSLALILISSQLSNRVLLLPVVLYF